MATIIEKVADVKSDTKKPDGDALARTLGRLATNAIRYGMGSVAWKEYMNNFATNGKQLARLYGDDPAFNQTEWGYQTLAYMVANSTCTINSNDTGTIAGFDAKMIENLNKFEETDASS